MEKIKLNLQKYKVVENNRGSQRGEMLDKFLEKLNPSRIKAGYKPLTHARMSTMLSHISIEDLHAFYKQCENSDIPFSAYFHWSLKPKK